ncbi:MFS transporter [Paenibacillus camelliae]|uniref:MFS transporter n=1 Tax=Paenibacillus camelliae TaxID=512410 RepID=UPI00203FA961|nr:MFS transporter [Paenibacillus camelliae]MCM3632370.1 MFS transporter [Paenibacillus camelliae]
MSQWNYFARLRRNFSSNSIPPDQRLGREAMISLIIHACFQFGASMSGLFLNLYLWRLTQDFTINAVYNIVNFGMTPFAFAIGGLIAKKLDRMVVYRLGIMLCAVFYLLVILAGETVPNYYIIFALLNGISSGFYWTGFLILQYDVSTDRNRVRYLAINMVTFNSAGLLGPALAGSIIARMEGLEGYLIIFLIAFIMFVIAAIISTKIKAIVSHHKKYYLKYVGLVMKKNKLWLYSLYSFFIFGLFQGIMLFLPNILLFQALEREDLVGYFGVLFSGITVATGYVISRKAQKEQARKYIMYATMCVVAASCMLLIDIKLWSVIIFMVVFSICNPLSVNSMTSYFYRLISGLPLKGQLKVESVVMREAFLNGGRVFAIFILIMLASDLQSKWLAIVIAIMAAAQFLILLLIRPEKIESASSEVSNSVAK